MAIYSDVLLNVSRGLNIKFAECFFQYNIQRDVFGTFGLC